jgi:hypothetical protein
MNKIIPFERLEASDLIVDAVYEGSHDSQLSGEPISKLLSGIGNLGGFRPAGRGEDKKFVVLYASGEDKDWPDRIDLNTGQFIYYGDNKTPGHELHDTHRGGNLILRRVFDLLHSSPPSRQTVPPFFVFAKHPTANCSRSVQFKGLAVPGHPGLSATEDLVAVWKTTNNQRFQNYRAVFTILDVPVVRRSWLNDLAAGECLTNDTPAVWADWVATGRYKALTSEPTTVIRSTDEQTPDTPIKIRILAAVHDHFKDAPRGFEAFAARIFQMHDRRVIIDEITRGSVDGGRDAIGRYLLGLSHDPVYVEFSLEAKCYSPPIGGIGANTVGIREVSRLISRIRHRQFGVLVTTSVVARQAYEEVREDRHPIVFICGKDIAEILINNGYNTLELVQTLLTSEFPVV